MKEKKENFQTENDLLQNDSACTDEIKSIILGNGNPLPELIISFFVMAIIFSFGLFLLFGNIKVVPEVFKSQIITKIFAFSIMSGIACLFLLYAIAQCKRLKIYNCQKRELENYSIDETIEDRIAQRTCPQCGDVHDIDYPKCPNCKFIFYK